MNNFLKRIGSSIVLIPFIIYFIFEEKKYIIYLTIILFLISIYEWNRIAKLLQHKFIGLLFLIFSFYTFYSLAINKSITQILFICIFTDIGGYIFGKILGGPKLTKISPNKTYAGVFGGYFLSLIFIYGYYIHLNYQLSLTTILLTLFFSSISQLGDIIISYFKRLSKIKNTGKIIPGHGGLLDRIDGMIFALPVFYFFNTIGFLN